jgi:hypothetical protein
MKDALSNEIILGEHYGYSKNSNGVTQIKVGKAKKFNKKTVTLEVVYEKTALYSEDPKEPTFPRERDTISVKGNLIFPVDIRLINK